MPDFMHAAVALELHFIKLCRALHKISDQAEIADFVKKELTTFGMELVGSQAARLRGSKPDTEKKKRPCLGVWVNSADPGWEFSLAAWLGAARLLVSYRNEFFGAVEFLFKPAGGLEGSDLNFLFGLGCAAGLEAGQIRQSELPPLGRLLEFSPDETMIRQAAAAVAQEVFDRLEH